MDKKSFANYEHKKKLKLNTASFLTQLVLNNLTCNLPKFGYSISFTRHHKSNVCRIFKHGLGIVKDKWYLTEIVLFKR